MLWDPDLGNPDTTGFLLAPMLLVINFLSQGGLPIIKIVYLLWATILISVFLRRVILNPDMKTKNMKVQMKVKDINGDVIKILQWHL